MPRAACTVTSSDACQRGVRNARNLAPLTAGAGQPEVIGRGGVGVEHREVEGATRRGIVVANAPGSTVRSAAEHTVGLFLPLSRNIPQAPAALKDGRWEPSPFGGIELAG